MLTNDFRAQQRPTKLAKRSGTYTRGEIVQSVATLNRVCCLLFFKSREELEC